MDPLNGKKKTTSKRTLLLVLFLARFMSEQELLGARQLHPVSLLPTVLCMLWSVCPQTNSRWPQPGHLEGSSDYRHTFVIIDLIQFLLNIFGWFKDPEVSM